MSGGAPWEEAVRRIVEDREHGASVLAERALETLAATWRNAPGDTPATVAREAAEAARKLRAARPSMPVLANGMNLAMSQALAGEPTAAAVDAREAGARAAADALAALREARGTAARRAAALARGRVFTHSASATVTKALRAAAQAGRLERVTVTESAPGREGRGVAEALAAEGVPVTFVTDAAAGLHVREADLVLVGADAILPDGSVVNKAGTRLVALAAREAGAPVYAVADAFKVSPTDAVPLEEKDPAEVWAGAPQGVRVRNIYFDRTPAALVTGVATDRGVLAPGDVEAISLEAQRRAAWEVRLRRRWPV